jgi:hypothetical protein
MSNSAAFGFETLEDSGEERGISHITMNGVEIEMVNTDDRATQYYFKEV